MVDFPPHDLREKDRLRALRETGLLDSPPEQFFDLITGLAARALKVPVVLLSLVDAERQFFKSQCGLPAPFAEVRETPLSHSFCQYVSAIGEAFIVEDSETHPLVRDNPAVRDLGVRAYAGIPLTTTQGFTLGSLCAIDTQPRRWTTQELETLQDFARQAMAEIDLRTRIHALDENLNSLRAATAVRQTETRHLVHDLRTPLNALFLGLDGLSMLGELTPEQQTCVILARKNADVLRDLVQRLIEKGAQEMPVDLRVRCLPHELVDRALDQVTPLARKAGVHLESGAVAPTPPILAQAHDLTRVLVNLLANGVKFTPRDGRVSIALATVRDGDGEVVRFVVSDDGVGIAPEDQERIFREGVRLDPLGDPRQSSGIGLAFCERVLRAHGAQLTLESARGEGSTFSFTLPVLRDGS